MQNCLRCKTPVGNASARCPHCGASLPSEAASIPFAVPVGRPQQPPTAPQNQTVTPHGYQPGHALDVRPGIQNAASPASGGGETRPSAVREIAPGVMQADAGAHAILPALLISLALPGGGQIYNRQAGKGGVFFMLSGLLVAYCLALVFADWLRAFGVFTLGVFVIAGLSTLDAALVARRLNRGEAVRKWQWF